MKKIWKVNFKVTDPSLYGKGKSVLSSFNIDVTTKMLPSAFAFITREIDRLTKPKKPRTFK